MSGDVLFSGDVITGSIDLSWSQIVETVSSGGLIQDWLLASPSMFRNWVLGILKSVGPWCFHYRYVPVIIIVLYCLFLVFYNWLWWYLLSKLQKKW